MTDHPTHDLAIARAERDAWQSTCEELHRAIAGRDVEIESHLGRCEAADQRARSLDAALTAEREAGRGLVAQVDALRKDLAHAQERLAERRTAQRGEVERLEAERDRLRDELRAIRDLVAPGNPQGTAVDAVRAMATGLIESIGARDAAEQARDMARDSRDAAIARAEAAERTLSGLYDDSKAELAKLRAELAELTVTRDRLLAREHEDGRLHAQLRAKLAELRARPVLTEDLLRGALDAHGHAALTRKLFAHLGPVTLPAQDRDESDERVYARRSQEHGYWPADVGAVNGAEALVMGAMLRSVGPIQINDVALLAMARAVIACVDRLGAPPTSPPAARPVFAGVSEDELIRLFYVVGTDGIDHGEQCPPIDISDRNGIRAVLARLEVSLVTPVDPEAVARAYHDHKDAPAPEWDEVDIWRGRDQDEQRAAIAAMRATLTAHGIPVTPKAGK